MMSKIDSPLWAIGGFLNIGYYIFIAVALIYIIVLLRQIKNKQ